MITQEMIDAGARAMYEQTSTYRNHHIYFDLLPDVVQEEMRRLARTAIEAALNASPMPES